MVNIYDQANALAASLKETEEYREYVRLGEVARADDTNRALLDEYKRLQFRMQARVASGEHVDEEELMRMQQIGSLLQFNRDAGAYLLAEFRLQKMIADIYKIIADAAGINLDMLQK